MPKPKMKRGNTGRARLSLCFFFFLSTLAVAAETKLTLSPYLDFSHSSNIFWNAYQVADTTLSPGLGLDMGTNSWNLFLEANGRFYKSNNYLNSSMVAGGVSFFKIISARTSLYVSPDFSLTYYQNDLSFLNTAVPGITVGVKHAFSKHVFSRLSLGMRQSNYLNEDSYDRTRLAAFLELSSFFSTQTTLRLTLGMNYLLFPHIGMPSSSAAWVAPAAGASADLHNRRGFPSRPVAPLDGEATTDAATIDLAIPQPYIVMRVAQGLGYKTGLVAEFLYRKNQNSLEGIHAIAASEWALEQVDEDFFWQGARISLGIKTEAFWGLEFALDFSYFNKEYKGIDALDLDGVSIQPLAFRSDTQKQVNMRIAKRIGAIDLFVAGGYRDNHSNDLYFRYDFFTISGGMELSI